MAIMERINQSEIKEKLMGKGIGDSKLEKKKSVVLVQVFHNHHITLVARYAADLGSWQNF